MTTNHKKTSNTVRACIYTRISLDRTGQGLGVERQEEMCREMAERNGWEVVEVFCDNSASAYSGKRRERFEELLEQTAAGEFDRIITYRTDRMYRRPRDLDRLIDAVEAHETFIEAVSSGRIDLSNSDGIQNAGVHAYISQGESMRQGERIKAQRAQARSQGRWTGGKRPFGYDLVPREERLAGGESLHINGDEAQWVRDWANGLLAGRSLNKMAGEANAAEVCTTQGGKWRSGTISRLLKKGVVAGLVEHKGELVGDGDWEPILDRTTWDRVRLILSDPKRKPADNTAKWLLSGIAECGKCGMKLHQGPSRNAGTPGYICRKSHGKNENACGGLRIAAEPTDEIVRDFLIQIVDGTSLDQMVEEEVGHDDILRGEIRRIDEKHDEAFDLWQRGIISAEELEANRAALADERKEHEVALVPLEARSVRSALNGNTLAERWDHLDLSQKRQIAKALLETVLIFPASVRGSKQFEPDRVLPWPKGQARLAESAPPA